jgi:hypothetical protein
MDDFDDVGDYAFVEFMYNGYNFGGLVDHMGATGDVPEPSTFVVWSILGVAVGFGVLRRRRGTEQARG